MSLRDQKAIKAAAGSDGRREDGRCNRECGGDARRARERDTVGNTEATQSALNQQVSRLSDHISVMAQKLEVAGHSGVQALPAPSTPLQMSGHAGAILPTMSHTSPVGAIVRQPSQKELQDDLKHA